VGFIRRADGSGRRGLGVLPLMSRYPRLKDGEWIQPTRRGYMLMCCDCRLIHRLSFRLVKSGNGHIIQFQAFRDERRTALARRKKKRKS
jgi:hypothetical protein